MEATSSYEELIKENRNLKLQLEEANETIDAIRTGQVDALIVQGREGHEIYTLKTADQTYRVFIEKMTEGAVTLNSTGDILYSNSRFAEMVSRPLSNVLGASFLDFVAEENKEDFQTLFKRSWTEDSKGETLLVTDNQIKIPFQLSLTTLELDEGFSLSVILSDLTQQKETQRQLKANNQQLAEINHALELSNNDLQQFASVASHDLQEPLRKILIFSLLLKEKHGEELTEESKGYLDKIINSSNRMKSLIIDILNYSRLSQNTNTFESTDLKSMINELIEDFEINIREKGASFHVSDLPVLEVNKGQMRQVFQNLISNALKFCKPKEPPCIVISEKQPGNHLQHGENNFCFISVKDNGIGFDGKYAQEIFSLFQRLHTKDKYEGTGIGLAITKKIIDKHQGRIYAISNEGEGAEFVIALPKSQSQKKTQELVSAV